MFILIAILFMAVGVLLFIKSKKMQKKQGLNMIVMISSVGFMLLGVTLIVLLLSGKIELPLGGL